MPTQKLVLELKRQGKSATKPLHLTQQDKHVGTAVSESETTLRGFPEKSGYPGSLRQMLHILATVFPSLLSQFAEKRNN